MNDHEGILSPQNDPSISTEPPKNAGKGWFRETLELFFIALLVVLPIRLFVANPFIVAGASMVPTFEDGDYLIVDEISYRFEEPKRGEVVVFRYPKNPSKYFIKRIIGLPGETLALKGGNVSIWKDGKKVTDLEEPYVKNDSGGDGTYVLKDDEYFVMGDNRPSSSDSRVWGVLPRENIVGRAWLRLFPPESFAVFPGRAAY